MFSFTSSQLGLCAHSEQAKNSHNNINQMHNKKYNKKQTKNKNSQLTKHPNHPTPEKKEEEKRNHQEVNIFPQMAPCIYHHVLP